MWERGTPCRASRLTWATPLCTTRRRNSGPTSITSCTVFFEEPDSRHAWMPAGRLVIKSQNEAAQAPGPLEQDLALALELLRRLFCKPESLCLAPAIFLGSLNRQRVPRRVKNCSLLMAAGTATSKKPTIISFHVCSPHTTVALGSGLCGLLAELSYQAMACNLLPAFRGRGRASR